MFGVYRVPDRGLWLWLLLVVPPTCLRDILELNHDPVAQQLLRQLCREGSGEHIIDETARRQLSTRHGLKGSALTTIEENETMTDIDVSTPTETIPEESHKMDEE